MANAYAGIFNTLAASFNEASLAKGGKNVLLTMVTQDFSPEVAAPFAVINTNIVNSAGTVTNLASGAGQTFQDVNIDPGAVTLNLHPTYGFPISSVDLTKSNGDNLIRKLRDEAIKKIGNYLNDSVAALITAANFPTYTLSGVSGADTVTDAIMGEAWAKLAANDIPVADIYNFFLVAHPIVYGNLIQSPSWAQSAYVGQSKATQIRETARLGLQWGAVADWDPDMPLPAGGTYASLLFHRYAMALVARAVVAPMNPFIPCTYVFYKGIPIRVIVDFDQVTMSDRMTFDALCGVAVVRPDHGCFMVSS
jgi:hypothetical protein